MAIVVVNAQSTVDTTLDYYDEDANSTNIINIAIDCKKRIKHVEKDRDWCQEQLSKRSLDAECPKEEIEKLKAENEGLKVELEKKNEEHKEYVKKMDATKRIIEKLLSKEP